ncbi:MAG TPA: CBASS oligonucleotide cyclase [Herpetosiphonaceae bacterium]|nr:CBASS oligonucleotide cyclase [Herpetosiphonaceae bacterium]
MATSISGAFSTFKSRLEVTDLQSQAVSTRQKNVREVIEDGLTVLDSFLTGSYIRSTMIAPLAKADIDVFFVLSADYYDKDGQGALLDRVKRVLKKKYTTPDISRDGQAVTVSFNDFQVDVVPGFNRKGGGYLIPNTQGGTWISTNPKEHVRISSEHNKAHNYDLIPLIKMLKCWNRNIGSHFRSFHLEVLAWQIFTGVTMTNFSSGARFFFDKGRQAIAEKNYDPSGYGGDVGYYINSREKIDDAVSRFSTAYNRAIKAEAYARDGNIADAIEEWQKIFGGNFPSYG